MLKPEEWGIITHVCAVLVRAQTAPQGIGGIAEVWLIAIRAAVLGRGFSLIGRDRPDLSPLSRVPLLRRFGYMGGPCGV